MTKWEDPVRNVLTVTKALSDPNRVRAVVALREHELCVCQIVAFLELAASTVSKHLSILEQARLVERRKRGRWVYYRRAGGGGAPAAANALRWLDASLENDAAVHEDAERLRRILEIPVDELCRAGDGEEE